MDPATRAARSDGADPASGGLTQPIWPATSYARDADGAYLAGRSYARDQNPTGEAAEALLAALETGADPGGKALLFSSGMAAAAALVDALAPGALVVAPSTGYATIRQLLVEQADLGHLVLRLVDPTDLDAWADALATPVPGRSTPEMLVWAETPANPMTDITDLAALGALADDAGATFAVDNTLPTPVHTRPIEHGAHVVFHSATKQLNGHGDVLAGALVAAPSFATDERWARVRHQREMRGAVLGPFEAWLLRRGMRTLHLRVRASSAAALALARAVEGHPAVAEVRYPGLPGHPGHAVAARQMDGGFGMVVALRLRGGASAARMLCRDTTLFCDASSLGGTESVIEHRAVVEGGASPVPDDLVRLAVGLEAVDDLRADLVGTLDAIAEQMPSC